MEALFRFLRIGVNVASSVLPVKKKTMLFASFSGRNFDDSPRELYEYIVNREEFYDWHFFWGLKDPSKFEIPGAKVIRFGSFTYWYTLLTSQVLIGNGGIDMGIEFTKKDRIVVNTWHGTPIKKIQGEVNSNKILEKYRKMKPIDNFTIRCCQSNYDKIIFSRVFRADYNCFIMSGLPRNDKLQKYNKNDIDHIKNKLNIPIDKKVLLYMPTYREFDVDENDDVFIKPPMNLSKWKTALSYNYTLLIRAHYAVSAALGVVDDNFVKNVSTYAPLTDLYAIADIMISDYSSAFFDFSIYGRPMRCFAYDLERYKQERGFYMDIEKELPCPIHRNEDELIDSIKNINFAADCARTIAFAKKYIPNEGHASEAVTEEILRKL